MAGNTLYIKVDQGGGLLTVILLLLVMMLMGVGVYSMGLVKNTYPYYEKQLLNEKIECKEFKKFLKSYFTYKPKDNFVSKLVKKNSDMLENMYNRGKDDEDKRYLYEHPDTTTGETQLQKFVNEFFAVDAIPASYLDGTEEAPKDFANSLTCE